jgi:hypothetical protein
MAWAPTFSRAPKVGICVPIKGEVSIEWAVQFAQMVASTALSGVDLAIFTNGHWELDYARNDLVEQSQRDHCTHVFFLDADIIPWLWENRDDKLVGQALDRIIAVFLAKQYPVVSGTYWIKRPPGGSNMMRIQDGTGPFTGQEVGGDMKDIVRSTAFVDAVGMGAVLIDIRVFDRVPYPWFSYYRSDEKEPNGRRKELSEDFYFGRKLKAAGFPVMVLGSVLCKHVGKVYFTWGGEANGVLMSG